ncbi:MATE family efflux transporter, partial [Patescibacteria group bacterium]|nr:MATE family efflux transporter [Patescibacteria group bacterium]
AVVSVTGASFGQHNFKKLNTAFMYALKIGVTIEVLIAIATFLFAPQIAAIFTRSEGTARIADDLIIFLKMVSLFYPTTAFGMFSSAMFQGTGKGVNALIITIIRTIVLTPLFALVFAFTLNMGLPGVWFGIVVGNTTGAAVAFLWAKAYIRNLMSEEKMSSTLVVEAKK